MTESVAELRLRKKIEFYLSVYLGWVFILLLGRTYRIKVEGGEIVKKLWRQKQNFLVASWHGRFLMSAYFFRFHRMVALVSRHLDGEMIARTIQKLGYTTVRGSSSRGGREAFYKMVTLLQQGESGVIIPDGPTGPPHKSKKGVILMAQQAQVPILPVSFSSRPAIRFKSWDRYMLPKPFARVLINIGEPFRVPQDLAGEELNKLKQRLDSEMIEQEQKLDAFFKI